LGQPGGLAQPVGGNRKRALVLHAIRHGGERPVGSPPNAGEKTGRGPSLGLRQRLDPARHLFLGGPGRVEVRAFRFGWRARHERVVVLQARPRPLVHEKEVKPRPALRRLVLDEIHQHRRVARPDLPEKNAIHDPRGVDDLRQRAPFVLWQRREIRADLNGRKQRCHHRFELHGGSTTRQVGEGPGSDNDRRRGDRPPSHEASPETKVRRGVRL